jgi:hypothetical protein
MTLRRTGAGALLRRGERLIDLVLVVSCIRSV